MINQKVLGSLSKNDRELIGSSKVVDYARKWVIAEAKNLIKNDKGLTVTQAVKQASTTGGWMIFDTKRNPSNEGATLRLPAQANSTESTDHILDIVCMYFSQD